MTTISEPILTSPTGFIVRTPSEDDAALVADLTNACALDAIGAPATTAALTLSGWRATEAEFHPERWLLTTPDGTAAAFGALWVAAPYDRFNLEGRVHPDFRGRGLGTYLMTHGEASARARLGDAPAGARVTLAVERISTNEEAGRLFEDHGYAISRHFWHMVMDLDQEPPAPEPPPGITIRAAIPGQDDHAVYTADEEAFLDHYDHTHISFEGWTALLRHDAARYDPSLWFTAWEGEEIAGVCLCSETTEEDPDMGWVETLGVLRPWRRRGVAMALLRHSFRELRRRGKARVGLGVDAASPTGATRLYERAGMHAHRRFVEYKKELRPAAQAADDLGGAR